ncbi:MAG: ProQ/FINO family protein [Nitrospirota bacterium]|jgi:sRNA-binding protein
MTDSAPAPDQTPAPTAAGMAVPEGSANAPASATGTPPPTGASRRGGRGRRNSSGPAGGTPAPQAEGPAKAARAPRPIPPTLEKLAELYPQLFGAVFLPLKRGIFQDLQAAHPDLFEREALKLALGIHTRSTRYLQSVAEGKPRHDLQGQPVEAMAPEHIHQALLEVHRRRQGRSAEDLQPKLVARIVRAIQASGLTREEYAERMHSRDEAANAVLAEALAALAALQAREEALLRAYEASGKTVAEFADMYGMDPRTAERSLHNARQRAAAPAPDAAA